MIFEGLIKVDYKKFTGTHRKSKTFRCYIPPSGLAGCGERIKFYYNLKSINTRPKLVKTIGYLYETDTSIMQNTVQPNPKEHRGVWISHRVLIYIPKDA